MTGVHDNPTLIQQLAIRGVRHLRAVEAKLEGPSLSAETLIGELARHAEPRFREALIPLFIRRPDDAALVPGLVTSLEPPADTVLRHMYTAAVYLQRLWHGTLGLYLNDFSLLPDHFGKPVFGLPGPDDRFGESGLRALTDLFKERTGYEWLSAYQSVMALLLDQLRLERSNEQQINGL